VRAQFVERGLKNQHTLSACWIFMQAEIVELVEKRRARLFIIVIPALEINLLEAGNLKTKKGNGAS
jgi:hypothetical protein